MVIFAGARHALLVCFSLLPALVFAQTTPAEFAEMSLQELLTLSTEETPQTHKRWSWSLRYQQAQFEGYLDGSETLSLDEVLFVPGGEVRSAKNFPVVPTVIKQRATIFGINYQWRERWRVSLALPYVQQETAHISIVPGYQQFLLKTHGIGDITLATRYRLYADPDESLHVNLGLSLPVGSIDEQGDTPRAPGEQQLPYTMQLGSGTWDFPIALSYRLTGAHDVRVDVAANIRTGQNDRHYRLGNRYSVKAKYQRPISDSVNVALGVELSHTDRIHGADESLLVATAFPYPAGTTNPDMYGGRKALASVGFAWQYSADMNLSVEFAKPLYQHLNGPQPQERWRGAVMLSRTL